MTSAVITHYVRSPFAFAHKGPLASVRPDDLASQVIKGLLRNVNVDPQHIEDVILGCSFPEGEQGLNLGRMVALLAGLPQRVAGVTVNRFCGSSMQSIHMAAGAIAAGAGDLFIAAGVESMTRIPMGGYNPMPNPDLYEACPGAYASMGETAENVAQKYGISREAQDKMAYESHQKAAKAQEQGFFASEIVPINQDGACLAEHDSCLRPETTLEKLASLQGAFDAQGTVTAGTSSPLTDGAAAVLVCSEEMAQKKGFKIMARVKAMAVEGCDPDLMGMGPVGATEKALKRAGLNVKDLDVIEINEAFASQALACIDALRLDVSKVNIDGGALALGHPLGATGARITGKAASLLDRTGGKYALATQCIGGGQGIATILERP